jgi:hypothetical protein
MRRWRLQASPLTPKSPAFRPISRPTASSRSVRRKPSGRSRSTAATAWWSTAPMAQTLRQLQDLLGPSGWPLLGNLPQIEPARFLLQLGAWARQYGRFFKLRMANRLLLLAVEWRPSTRHSAAPGQIFPKLFTRMISAVPYWRFFKLPSDRRTRACAGGGEHRLHPQRAPAPG